jgi:8-oxo-dGTP diphosphatase
MGLPKTPALTTDCVIFDGRGRVLLTRRGHPPFEGGYALPGGFVETGETVENACRREVLEEVGIEVGDLRLVGVYSDPARDPRGHTVSVAYLVVLLRASVPRAGSDAAGAEWVEDWRALTLAFDHAQILADAEALKAGDPRGKMKTRR